MHTQPAFGPSLRLTAVLSLFWRDQRGEVAALAYMLMVTLIGIGIICGLTTFRDQMINVLGDIALSLENVNQSYSITVTSGTVSVTSSFHDTNTPLIDPNGAAPLDINHSVSVTGE